jgi:hypothetical protein
MATLQPHAVRQDDGGIRRVAVLALAILQILTPVLPSLGFGTPIGDQSDGARTLITPAGWAFSIWGPLYARSLAFALWQILPRQRDNALAARIGWPAAGAFLGNALWALYTQSEGLTVVSSLIILFTLACLLVIYRIFAAQPHFTRDEAWAAVLPLSALAAWLTAASIVNIAASLTWHEVALPIAPPLAAVAVIIVGGVIAGAALLRGGGNPWYAAVFLWALAAIYAAHAAVDPRIGGAVVIAAILVVIGAAVPLSARANRQRWFAAG